MKKQNLRKIITMGLIATSLIAVAPMQVNAEWKQGSSLDPKGNVQYGGWYYTNSDGSHKTGWLLDKGNWYYLDPDKDGYMVDWTIRTINGVQYGFDRDGKMVNGKVNWNSNKTEAIINGVQYDNIELVKEIAAQTSSSDESETPSNYYKFHIKGMSEDYRQVDAYRSFLVNPNTNEILIGKVVNPLDGRTYLTDYKGELQFGFQLNSNTRKWEYYNRKSGALETGIKEINGKTYNLDDVHLNDFNYEAGNEFICSNDESILAYTKDYLIENPSKQSFLNEGIDEAKYIQITTSKN